MNKAPNRTKFLRVASLTRNVIELTQHTSTQCVWRELDRESIETINQSIKTGTSLKSSREWLMSNVRGVAFYIQEKLVSSVQPLVQYKREWME